MSQVAKVVTLKTAIFFFFLDAILLHGQVSYFTLFMYFVRELSGKKFRRKISLIIIFILCFLKKSLSLERIVVYLASMECFKDFLIPVNVTTCINYISVVFSRVVAMRLPVWFFFKNFCLVQLWHDLLKGISRCCLLSIFLNFLWSLLLLLSN